MDKTTIKVGGLHCKSCELIIEEDLSNIKGVKKVTVSQAKGIVDVTHDDNVKIGDLEKRIAYLGYQVLGDTTANRPSGGNSLNDYLLSFLLVLILVYIAKISGIFNYSMKGISSQPQLMAVLLIGLVAGLSTCMALIGGLVLGVSARYAEKNGSMSSINKFIPNLYFNAGRVVGFFVLGGLIGLFGSLFQFSGLVLGTMTVLVGIVMIALAIQILGFFPKATLFVLPKRLNRIFGITARSNNSFSSAGTMILGMLTFFLPCGFTQAMQLYAMSSGRFLNGGLIMAAFALGTAPGLLGIGASSALVKGKAKSIFFKTTGLILLIMAVFNISNGITLAGWRGVRATSGEANRDNIVIEDGKQIIKMTQTVRGYSPSNFVVYKDVPVKWVINAQDSNTCSGSILMDKYGIRRVLKPGENIIEFTPREVGDIKFSCMMGMYGGSFVVIEKGQKASLPVSQNEQIGTSCNHCGSSSICGAGCGCGGGCHKQ